MRLLAAAALLIHPSAPLQTVGIVGAGPAGLTLAVALNRALPDVAVTIFDRSDSCRPALGGGVQLNSGAAVLARLDPALGAAVAALGQPVRRVRSRTAGGDGLLDLDLAAAIRGNARARERGLVDADGGVTPLKNKNIDTGMGLERMAQILQGVPNNYETDLIMPIINKAASMAGIDYNACNDVQKQQLKVIGDHTRAVSYMISDGVFASNIGRGYIVRRLLRRVVRNGRLLGIKPEEGASAFTPAIACLLYTSPSPRDRG